MANTADSATFDLDVDASKLQQSADAAIKSVQQLAAEFDAGAKAVGDMQKALRVMRAGGSATAEQTKALTAQIKAQKTANAESLAAFIKAGGAVADLGKKTAPAAQEIKKVDWVLKDTVKDLDVMNEETKDASKIWERFAKTDLGKATVSLMKIGAAIGVVTAAMLAAVVALAKYGLASANARRAELLRLEGLTKVRNWWGIAAGNAKDMQKSLDRVTDSVALGREEIGRYQTQLYQAGFRGQALDDTLEAMAITAATQGEAQAQAFAGWASAINRTGGSVKKLANDVKARLGGIAARQMLDLNVLAQKFHESFSRMFDDLPLEPLAKAVQGIIKLFSQSNASGRALKQLLTTMLSPFIRATASGLKSGRAFFLGLIYGALKLESAILGVLIWWKKTFGLKPAKEVDNTVEAFDRGATAIWAVVAAMTALLPLFVAFTALTTVALLVKMAIAWWALVAPIWANVAAFGALMLELLPLIVTLALVAAGIYFIIEIAKELWQLWQEIDWAYLGKAIWEGITSFYGGVFDWFKGLGKGIAKAFGDAIGAHSPSKVFAQYGEAIGEGLQQGIDKTSPEVNASLASTVTPPALDVPKSSAGGRGAAGGGIQIGDVNIVIAPRDGESPEGTAQRMGDAFVERITELLRSVNDQLGGAEVTT